MKLEEEFGPDRMIQIETDDEENEAERVCHNHEDDSESDITLSSRDPSFAGMDSDPCGSWPQSYRQSMDMYTMLTHSISKNSFLMPSVDKRPHTISDAEFSLLKPLISETRHREEEVPSSALLVRQFTACGVPVSICKPPLTQQCTYSQSVINGILSTPYALKEGGWFSILLLFTFGIITCYTGILLKRCLESSTQLQTYPDIGQAAFGLSGRICIAVILYLELYSSCVEYLIMMGDNLSAFFPNAQMDIYRIHLDSCQMCVIIAAIVILPTVWFRNLSLLSYISAGGVLTLVLVVVCLLWVGATSEIGFHPSGNSLNFAKLPLTIGIYSFCYGSHSVFPNIYSSMDDPSRFHSLLVISFAIAGLLYAGVAVFGFLMFGEATDPQFTLNLPKTLIASKIAGWTVVVAPVTKFSLSLTPVALGIEELLPPAQSRSQLMSILIRTSLVFSTLIIALTIPYFGSVMAMIGSFLVMLVSVIVPCACYMRIHRGGLTKLQIAACLFIIVVGVFCAIVGTYSAMASMKDSSSAHIRSPSLAQGELLAIHKQQQAVADAEYK
ncbi:vacuolar amino acid transporter 1-like [Dorcoceras hygrometricum]|uniref:Vacuolar amino acid transporter 1-like n=1 Tax=Dorcoceras hygrometricum TaxID=472368 RepID=A0A2Z7DC35_9LAMI|nr:vacuolar amino acid transporter 1-like [Dorcoceras hygrometricum]